MEKQDTLRIKTITIENEVPEVQMRNALSSELINKFTGRVKEKISEIPITSLESQFNHLVKGMQTIFDNLSVDSNSFDVDEIKFTCTVSNSGEVSILGMVEGGMEYQKGIEIVLKRKLHE